MFLESWTQALEDRQTPRVVAVHLRGISFPVGGGDERVVAPSRRNSPHPRHRRVCRRRVRDGWP